MKKPVLHAVISGLCACSLLAQCVSKPQTVYNKHGQAVATALATPTGYVTRQQLGDTTVLTRRLINRALTNADCGKAYEEVTVVSPRGTSVQRRIIVRALPRLELRNESKD